jgi:hypothetical protein
MDNSVIAERNAKAVLVDGEMTPEKELWKTNSFCILYSIASYK